MSHRFGDLLRQHLSRKHGLTQTKLAEGILQEPAIITRMAQGQRLTGKQARERVVTIIDWLYREGVLAYRTEADAFLLAANMAGLGVDEPAEAKLLACLKDENPLQAGGQLARTVESAIPFLLPALPPQGVFGRNAELERMRELLYLSDEKRMAIPPLALRGMAGIGKTTLATAFGHLPMIPQHFPDGVLWVALGPTPTIRMLLEVWGQALGVELLRERNEEACSQRLRSLLFHRRMLIIIDDVWEVKHATYFTIAGPHSCTLLTTRELPIAYALATSKRTLHIGLLNPENALDLLGRLAPETVSIDRSNALRLCARLEYLPLALTLAGRMLACEAEVPGRIRRLIDELIERREARLQLLQSEGRPGLQAEEISLQAILGLSVERLNRADQELFAMLSVFGGDPLTWEIEALVHVWQCSVLEAEAAISRLIQRGLVERRGDRYWMHALLADYAAEMYEELKL